MQSNYEIPLVTIQLPITYQPMRPIPTNICMHSIPIYRQPNKLTRRLNNQRTNQATNYPRMHFHTKSGKCNHCKALSESIILCIQIIVLVHKGNHRKCANFTGDGLRQKPYIVQLTLGIVLNQPLLCCIFIIIMVLGQVYSFWKHQQQQQRTA